MITLVTALCLAPATATAGGIVLPGLGAQAQARGGAFTAKADDPTALYHNPAGFAKQSGTVLLIGVNVLDYSLKYQRAGTYDATGEDLPFEGDAFSAVENDASPGFGVGPLQTTPYFGVATDLGLDLPVMFGFGFYAPHSYPDRNFTPDYVFEDDPNEAPPPQRYDIMSQEAVIILPSIAAAYRVLDNLDVGVRLSWGRGDVKATSYVWGIRNYEEWVARDGVFTLSATDNFMPSFGAGVLFRPTPAFEFGFTYDSGVLLDGKGWGKTRLGSDLGLAEDQPDYLVPPEDQYAKCGADGTDQDHLRACIKLALPQTAALGSRYIIRDAAGDELADVEFDVKWENWGATNVSDVEVIVDGQSGLTGFPLYETYLRHGFQDVFSFRLGGSYRLPLGPVNKLAIRGGVSYDTATAPLKWTRLDQDGARRAGLNAGVAYETKKLRVEVGAGLVIEPDRTVGQCNPTTSNKGCLGTGVDSPQADREAPDPLQPLIGPNNQVESPFNAGTYQSGYLLMTLGVAYKF